MTWQIIFTDQYNRRAAKFIGRNPQIEGHYAKTLELLALNPYHPSLRLHALQGKLTGLHSVSINLKYRITVEMIITDHEIVLINIGDHDRVY
jgi:mRNA-degrading endonuclease YafQ of YafQ-DinJ toxin-antitoxin module